jgi:hypothetical protein
VPQQTAPARANSGARRRTVCLIHGRTGLVQTFVWRHADAEVRVAFSPSPSARLVSQTITASLSMNGSQLRAIMFFTPNAIQMPSDTAHFLIPSLFAAPFQGGNIGYADIRVDDARRTPLYCTFRVHLADARGEEGSDYRMRRHFRPATSTKLNGIGP